MTIAFHLGLKRSANRWLAHYQGIGHLGNDPLGVARRDVGRQGLQDPVAQPPGRIDGLDAGISISRSFPEPFFRSGSLRTRSLRSDRRTLYLRPMLANRLIRPAQLFLAGHVPD